MSVQQYIGARYVPKFYENELETPEWRPNVQYEPLTIVTYAGNSYTSKIPVPANIGDPSNNPHFWASTGDYNAQVAQLSQDVQDLSDNFDIYKADKTELILFGDSWADRTHDPNNACIDIVLGRELNLTVHNYSYGGTGFDVPNGYDEQIDWMEADTSFDHSKIKYAILVAGLNEYHNGTSAADFATKLNDWASKLKAKIGNQIPVYWFHNYSIENDRTVRPLHTSFYTQRNYYKNVEIGIRQDVIPVTTFAWVDADHWNTNNYSHPVYAGSEEYALNMVKTIGGAAPILHMYDKVTGVADTTDVSAALRNVPIKFYLRGDVLWAEFLPPMALLAVTGSFDINYPRNVPAPINEGMYISQGKVTFSSGYNKVTLTTEIPGDITWSTTGSGRARALATTEIS